MRAQGIDISKHNPPYNPAVKKHDFVFMRASYSTKTDEEYDRNYNSIANVPVRGAYHYYSSFGAPHDKLFWEKQADYFLETVKNSDFHLYILDYEKIFNQPSRLFARGAKKWLDYVAKESGKKVILYTNRAIYHEFLLQYGQNWMNNYHFWIAQWPFVGWDKKLEKVTSISGGWNPALPAGHKDWKFWQFSADGNQKGPENGIKHEPWLGAPPSVDLDVFNGTVQDLMDWLNLEHEAGESEAEEPSVEEESEEPAEGKPTYAELTNQNMIDLIFRAAKSTGGHYWDHWIVNAQLEYLAIPGSNRPKPYTGPKIENLPGLTADEKGALLALI
jgi:GH25 family lysozyme M1 (1,4-beta-N-acetylmuramidase)